MSKMVKPGNFFTRILSKKHLSDLHHALFALQMSVGLKPGLLKIALFLLVLFWPASESVAQNESAYDAMTLEELLDVEVVVTASKKPEDLFEAPLSTTIIKRQDIEASGVTTIMEALRLAPGMIVRETTPDNYDIQIRGFDDITKNAYLTLPFNTTTLVMIDNRIVYSYFTGGTFWEALPIDLHDVERIEIVRGPASALYGSNATTGVINIITRHSEKRGLNTSLSALVGTLNTRTIRSRIGYNWNNITQLSFSGHASKKDRSFKSYYNWAGPDTSYMALEDLRMVMAIEQDTLTHEVWDTHGFREAMGATYDPELSQRKIAGNLFFSHHPSTESFINIDAGMQWSQAQKPGFLNFITPLSINTSQSAYSVLRFKNGNSFGQFSATQGSDKSNYRFNSYTYTNYEGSLEYLYERSQFSLRPGVGMKRLNYASPLTHVLPFQMSDPYFQGVELSRLMHVASFSMLSEWLPSSKFRLIGGLRLDHFDINTNLSVNYEIASTYRYDMRNLFRMVHSRATRSPFFFETYLNTALRMNGELAFEGNTHLMDFPVDMNLQGRSDQKYLSNTNTEIAWRKKLSRGMSFDFELFTSRMNNLIVSNLYRDLTLITQLDSEGLYDSVFAAHGEGIIRFENFDITPRQSGATFIFSIKERGNLNINFFGTFQNTRLSGNIDQQFVTTQGSFNIDTTLSQLTSSIQSWTNPTLWSKKLTPKFYGGFDLHLSPARGWKFSLNGYLSTRQSFGGLPFSNVISDFTQQFWYDYDDLDPYAVFNLKISRKLGTQGSIYFIGKNLGKEHKEYGFADLVGPTYLVGVTWDD